MLASDRPTETPFIRHRATCQHCKTMPYLCDTGAKILRRSMEQTNAGTKPKESHAQVE